MRATLAVRSTMEEQDRMSGQDPAFADLVLNAAFHVGLSSSAEEVYLIHVDNWFDHKWLNWPASTRVSKRYSKDGPDQQAPVPSFTLSRILSQDRLRYDPTSARYILAGGGPVIHGYDGMYHGKHRRLADISQSAVFLWYSGNTGPNGQGSMMAYVYTPAAKTSWYASFRKAPDWRVHRTKGIPRQEVERLVAKDQDE